MLAPWLQDTHDSIVNAFTDNKLHHAILFYGSEGNGKRVTANTLVNYFLCLSPYQYSTCGECQSCRLVSAGNHPDLLSISGADSAIGIDAIRSISDFISKKSQLNSRKVVFIDSCDNMSVAAANALLKNLEEPTDNTYVILTTNKLNKLLPTITSRALKYRISSTNIDVSLNWLSKQLPHNKAQLEYLMSISGNAPHKVLSWHETNTIDSIIELVKCVRSWMNKSLSSKALKDHVLNIDQGEELFFKILLESLDKFANNKNSPYDFNLLSSIIQVTNCHHEKSEQVVGTNKESAFMSTLYRLEQLL